MARGMSKGGEMTKVWIPKKIEIENMLRNMADKVRVAENISGMEMFLDDLLSELSCHVTNRASVERGDIEE